MRAVLDLPARRGRATSGIVRTLCRGGRAVIRAILLAGVVVVVDQISKALISRTMALHESIPLLPSLNLTYTRNPGAAFSLLADADATFRFWFFLVVSLAAVVMILGFLRQVPPGEWWTLVALGLILGGAVGNLIDRMRFGEVIDFIDVYAGAYHWPVFNVADSGITVGMVMLLGHLLFQKGAQARSASTL